DNKTFVTAVGRGVIHLFDVASGKEVKKLGGVSGALNEGSLCPTITSSDDNWLFRPIPDPACDGRPEPLLLSKPCLPGLRPTGSGQLDRLRPLWQTATPSAVLQDLQGPLLRTQGHAPVR